MYVHVRYPKALIRVARYGSKDVTELLLKYGADLHATDDLALRYVARDSYIDGYRDVVELLLKTKSNSTSSM